MSTGAVSFNLKTPCADCPFRSDKPFPLRFERVQSIAAGLRDGGQFPCHKTVHYTEDEEGASIAEYRENTNFCAGALIVMEKEGYSNQQVRIAERLGIYDIDKMDLSAPVFDSLSEWVASYREIPTVEVSDGKGGVEVLELEHCGVVGPDCEDPPGWSMGGGIAHNDEIPTLNPIEDACDYCGNTMCPDCRAGEGDVGRDICYWCLAGEDEEDEDDD